jgi:hypothetical protein
MKSTKVKTVNEIPNFMSDVSNHALTFRCAAIGDGLIIYHGENSGGGKYIIETNSDQKDFFEKESIDSLLAFNNLSYLQITVTDKDETPLISYEVEDVRTFELI